MSRRLRDDLRDVFEGLSEPAHPALSARIRHQIATRPATAARPPRLAAAVAVLAAVLVVVSLIFVSRHGLPPVGSAVPAGVPTPRSSATAAPITASPATASTATPVPGQPGPGGTPTPAASPSGPAFSCAAQSAPGLQPGPVGVTAVRAGAQSGYDRFVIEFDGPVPPYDVTPQASATFDEDASGRPVELTGSAGLRVVVRGARGAGSYTGPTDLRPSGTAVLREARQIGDFEGVYTWGLGLSRAACYRVLTLKDPSRLVIDVQA